MLMGRWKVGSSSAVSVCKLVWQISLRSSMCARESVAGKVHALLVIGDAASMQGTGATLWRYWAAFGHPKAKLRFLLGLVPLVTISLLQVKRSFAGDCLCNCLIEWWP